MKTKPKSSVSVSAECFARLEAAAAKRGTTAGKLARELVEQYLAARA